METHTEFDMMHSGQIQPFEAAFEWLAWSDSYDNTDSLSYYIDWTYGLLELSYTDEEGKQHMVDYKLLRPEYKDLVDYSINSEIENEINNR